jgi:hypothetical protein
MVPPLEDELLDDEELDEDELELELELELLAPPDELEEEDVSSAVPPAQAAKMLVATQNAAKLIPCDFTIMTP